MSIGHAIMDEIIHRNMLHVAYPDPDASHVFVWSSGAPEQLEALVQKHVGAIPLNLNKKITPDNVSETLGIISNYIPERTDFIIIFINRDNHFITTCSSMDEHTSKKHLLLVLKKNTAFKLSLWERIRFALFP